MRGFTLLELLVVIVVIMIASALILPNLARQHDSGCRASCANNLGQIGKAMMMYSDVPEYASFPTGKKGACGNPLPSLGILYRDFISDKRVFSCPLKPTLDKLVNLGPTVGSSTSCMPLNATMTHYGYDPGNTQTDNKPHTPNDSQAVIVADNGPGTSPSGCSDNHGIGLGQNCLLAAGSVEWHTLVSNNVGTAKDGTVVSDPSIFTSNAMSDPTLNNMDSYVRQ